MFNCILPVGKFLKYTQHNRINYTKFHTLSHYVLTYSVQIIPQNKTNSFQQIPVHKWLRHVVSRWSALNRLLIDSYHWSKEGSG
jgi:hypothetical protein